MVIRHCVLCGNAFQATDSKHRYCSPRCAQNQSKRARSKMLNEGRFCRQCGQHFFPDLNQQNRQHCTLDCSVKSARQSRSKFWEKLGSKKKEKMASYYAKSREKLGPDGNLKRFYARHPNAPHECQSCGEARVLDIAHKPNHSRNGAWRSVKNTSPEKVWILCPTCHALLDRMNYPPDQLGLK